MGEFNSVQFSSVVQSCLTLCDPTNRSTPGLPVHHQLLELTQTHADDHYIYYCGQGSLRRNGVAIIVNKTLKYSTWMQSQK